MLLQNLAVPISIGRQQTTNNPLPPEEYSKQTYYPPKTMSRNLQDIATSGVEEDDAKYLRELTRQRPTGTRQLLENLELSAQLSADHLSLDIYYCANACRQCSFESGAHGLHLVPRTSRPARTTGNQGRRFITL